MPFIERQICKHPLVSRAMMFGREQFHPGVIIEPVEGNRLDPSNKSAVEHFIDKIWYLNSPLMLLDRPIRYPSPGDVCVSASLVVLTSGLILLDCRHCEDVVSVILLTVVRNDYDGQRGGSS